MFRDIREVALQYRFNYCLFEDIEKKYCSDMKDTVGKL